MHILKRDAAVIGLHINAHKTEYMCFNQTGYFSSLNGSSLKIVDKFTSLGSSVSPTETNINSILARHVQLTIGYRSYGSQNFQEAVVSILLYGCTKWTLTKRFETKKNKLDGNYKRMPRAILNLSWRQHHTKQHLCDHLPPITKTRRTRHARHCCRSTDELISDVMMWTSSHGRPARIYTQKFFANTECSPEDLSVWFGLVCWDLWHINLCRLFNAKSIFM